jgi:hypothetical protein
MSTGTQNMKMGPDALGNAENESGSAKYEKRDPTPSAPPLMFPGAQNMKSGPDAVCTAENEFGRAKHKNVT